MMNGAAPVSIATRSKDYAGSRQEAGKEVVDGPPPPPVSGSLEIEKPTPKPVVKPPSKGVLLQHLCPVHPRKAAAIKS